MHPCSYREHAECPIVSIGAHVTKRQIMSRKYTIPAVRLPTIGRRAFLVAGPRKCSVISWNVSYRQTL